MPETLAIIPARGGSKGIPRKNVRPLAGKPLLAWTIAAARAAATVTRVVVSTDDAEIGQVARRFGAEVIWRPATISGDTASSETALLHALDHLREAEGYQPDLLVFLQCTAPFTTAEDIDGTVAALQSEDADTALAVAPFHYFLWQHDDNGNAVGINHDKRTRLLRQQQAPQYLEAGAVYVMRVAGFLAARHRFFGQTALYVMPAERCGEIDEPVDFLVAEVRLREQLRRRMQEQLPARIEALVSDFDGVFTDNKVITAQDGTEAVVCDRSDGMGIAALKRLGIPVLVLSKERNPVVQARCDKLGIACIQGQDDKLDTLTRWAAQHQIDLQHVVYVGNDINDRACLLAVGCGVAVADAYPEAQTAARLLLTRSGGHGALRELCDLIVAHVSPQGLS